MDQALDQLPPSGDEYFTKYDADTNQIPIREPKACNHKFIRKSGSEIECEICHIGFFITPEFELKDKHIYKDKQLVI